MELSNSDDPFIQVQHDVLTQLAATRPLFESYLRIRSLSTTATSPELTAARADLEDAIASLAEDLADLVESVRAVEDNPLQFNLSQAELRRRQSVVNNAGQEVQKMRKELTAVVQTHPPRGSDLPDPSSFAIGPGSSHDDYAEFEREQQLQMMNEQDQHLDGVFQTVGNLRRQADDMGRELEEQREMLEVADDLADRVGGRLQTGMQKLQIAVYTFVYVWVVVGILAQGLLLFAV
ncbi:hypothetical protein SEPCBS119000_002476 [Sporothrix epigloea]|uniref:t-SNARE coiled-coil homology domain-containing protein n=1 Tax=Sporothrix epigloea TaxID=1892477 RepID=A0ABP0DGM1_9PEZI